MKSEIPPAYGQWLNYVFNRPNEKSAWFFSGTDPDFEAEPDDVVELVSATFRNAGRDLAKYSDLQLKHGLSYILYNYASDTVLSICRKGVAEERRIEAVRNMSFLYRDCFAVRCAPVLSHLDEAGANALNAICYMLWDESPLCQWHSVVLDVMDTALYLPNPACVESALHGLNHRFRQSESEVVAIIDRFLATAKGLRPELRRYALRARSGVAL